MGSDHTDDYTITQCAGCTVPGVEALRVSEFRITSEKIIIV